jgi:hypothetical protein
MENININKFKILIRKIVKTKCNIDKILGIIFKNTSFEITPAKLSEISNVIFSNTSCTKYLPNNKSHVANKIITYLQTRTPLIFNTPSPIIADIGGGNGDLLQCMYNSHRLPHTKLLCIESDKEWSEPYSFSCPQVNYLLWNGISPFFGVNNQSLNLITATVSLHHMNDYTLEQLMKNIEANALPGSLFIIKEHDCVTNYDRNIIDWEHHLYHITQLNKIITLNEAAEYLNFPYIANFKSKSQFDDFIKSFGYAKIDEFDRHIGHQNGEDVYNPTNLYWSIYQKK